MKTELLGLKQSDVLITNLYEDKLENIKYLWSRARSKN